MTAPGYWQNETSGVLRLAVERYLSQWKLSREEVSTMRAYFRQWINAPGFTGEGVERTAEVGRGNRHPSGHRGVAQPRRRGGSGPAMRGPGKYDSELTAACKSADADSGILIILGGDRGSGFSVQATLDVIVSMPDLLRKLADEVEQDLAGG